MQTKNDCPLPPGSPVWAYLRVSGDEQAERGTPIAGQRRYLNTYCQQHNLNLLHVFVDEARTGSSTVHRDAFNGMIAQARRDPRPVDGILIWSWSRFAREEDDAHFFKADLRRRGYVLVSLTDDVPEGEFQYVFEALVHWKDAQYLKDLRAAVKRGHHTLAAQGYSPGGFPPVGYKTVYVEETIEGKKRQVRRWVQDRETWERVVEAWQMRAAGATYKEIHERVNLFKALNSYADMFKNSHYLGILRWGDTEVENAIPAAVDRTTWDAVQARRKDCPHPRRANPQHILSGLARCAYCGRALSGITQAAGGFRLSDGRRLKITGASSPYYRCELAHHDHDACPGIGYPRAETLERAVIETVANRILTPEHLAELLTGYATEDLQRLDAQRASLENQKREIERAISRLVDAVEHQGWSPALSDRLSEREAKRERIAAQLAALDEQTALYLRFAENKNGGLCFSVDALSVLCRALVDELQASDPSQVNQLLQTFLIRIEVGREEMVLYYTFPIHLELDHELGIVYGQHPRQDSNLRPTA